ncbi:LANO_0H01222g1_1 [Lachancea nothofagi CBS 11611]|uniref:LANO_0H01222g1_1 n=1 Tax=Lachancea nothofagi CBS 11611 TaxID=1266666 RepID=A0A1G4KL72_9SACH|nr:LANO_0H01222g1_1 [Lachancea nothofagi CBS 11611]
MEVESRSEKQSDHQITQHVLQQRKDAGVSNVEVYAHQYNNAVYRTMLFFSIFLVAYAYGLDGTVRYTFQSYATSSYAEHSLLATVNCIKSVIAAAGQIWFARASDIFGRVEILAVSVVFYIIGTIVESQAVNVTKFAVGACFYQLGYTGIVLILEVIAADFSNLNWRLVAAFVPALPFIINTWISGDVVTAVGMNWKWGIGMWAFILPLACIPLFGCMIHMRYLANKNAKDQLQTEIKLYKHMKWSDYFIDIFFWRFDILGLLLLVAVFGCILVPLTIAQGLKDQWRAAHIIVPEVIGWCLALPLFLLWEIKFAKHPLAPWKLVKDRGIFSALFIAFHINFIWYMQGDYMYPVLLVAVNESMKSATRITSLYSFVSVITGFILGFVIVFARKTKKFILFGVGCWFISFGLLVHYRGDSSSHAGIIGSLCLLGFGAGFFTYTTQVSIQASAKTHQELAVVTASYLATYNIGSAVGSAVSGAIWTNVLPKELRKRISDSDVVAAAYSSPYTFIVDYAWGTPNRQAVVKSYQVVQKLLCIVGLCFCTTLLASAFLLRDHTLKSAVALEESNASTSSDAQETDESHEEEILEERK